MIGAGAVVTQSVPNGAVVVGNPARIVRFVEATDERAVHNQTVQDGARDG